MATARQLGRSDVVRFYAAYVGRGDIQNLSTIKLIVAQTIGGTVANGLAASLSRN
jgi:hypothetical protein